MAILENQNAGISMFYLKQIFFERTQIKALESVKKTSIIIVLASI